MNHPKFLFKRKMKDFRNHICTIPSYTPGRKPASSAKSTFILRCTFTTLIAKFQLVA